VESGSTKQDARTRAGDYYTEVVLPALAERLDAALPEFGWRRDERGWVATNEELTHRVLGVRAERVVAHGHAPRGFLVHGGEAMLWTAYLNGGVVPRGEDFVRAVKELAERAGVDTSPIEQAVPRDRRAELLEDFFALCRDELASPRAAAAREYLERRGLPAGEIERAGLGLAPPRAQSVRALRERGYSDAEIARAAVLSDSRWPGRIVGAWRDERGRIGTLWARSLTDDAPQAKYLYLRGASRAGLPPYGLTDVLAWQPYGQRELVLVEGFFDVHHLRSRGITGVAALGGTAVRSQTFERLTGLGFVSVTLCLDRDDAGRAATARAVDQAARAAASPAVFAVDPDGLAPAKDPDELVRQRGVEGWHALLAGRTCGVVWRAHELASGVVADSPALERREALARAGVWLGGLPPRLAIEQEDAIRALAERCGYSQAAVERAFRARFWSQPLARGGSSPARPGFSPAL